MESGDKLARRPSSDGIDRTQVKDPYIYRSFQQPHNDKKGLEAAEL